MAGFCNMDYYLERSYINRGQGFILNSVLSMSYEHDDAFHTEMRAAVTGHCNDNFAKNLAGMIAWCGARSLSKVLGFNRSLTLI
jgi:hypothetical protein